MVPRRATPERIFRYNAGWDDSVARPVAWSRVAAAGRGGDRAAARIRFAGHPAVARVLDRRLARRYHRRLSAMGRYLVRRFLYVIVVLWIVSVVSFLIIQLPPGDYLSSYPKYRAAARRLRRREPHCTLMRHEHATTPQLCFAPLRSVVGTRRQYRDLGTTRIPTP